MGQSLLLELQKKGQYPHGENPRMRYFHSGAKSLVIGSQLYKKQVIDRTGAPATRLVLDSPVAFAEIEAKVPSCSFGV